MIRFHTWRLSPRIGQRKFHREIKKCLKLLETLPIIKINWAQVGVNYPSKIIFIILNYIEREKTAIEGTHWINLAPTILVKITASGTFMFECLIGAFLRIAPNLQKFFPANSRIFFDLIDFFVEHDGIVYGTVCPHARATVLVGWAVMTKTKTARIFSIFKTCHAMCTLSPVSMCKETLLIRKLAHFLG